MELKIGVLLPRSDMFPALGLNLINGFKLSFKKLNDSGISPTYCIENVGNAAEDSIIKIIEKLFLQENVDLLIGFFSVFKLPELTPMINAYKKPFIHIDLGGSVLKEESKSPYILHHTLGLSQSTYAAGMYAAKKIGKKALAAASFYDGGYHLTESFVKGYLKNGGSIEKFYVSPMDYKSESFETLLAGIEEAKPDVIFAAFSFKEGNKVFDILAKSKYNNLIPIIAIPLMTDETTNTENHHIEKVFSVASWSFDDPTPEMQNFINEYLQAYEELPNIIGLLGFEVGLTMLEIINSKGKIEVPLSDALNKKSIDSPRGKLTYNCMNESQTASFKLRKFNFNKTTYHNTVIENIDASFFENLYSEFEEIPYTGWLNPYICT